MENGKLKIKVGTGVPDCPFLMKNENNAEFICIIKNYERGAKHEAVTLSTEP